MERGHIYITETTVRVTYAQGTVWLSRHQIADLLGVFVSKVSGNIRSIIKSGQLREKEVMHTHHFDGGSVDLYNLEMITALAFRFDGAKSEIFRKWVIRKLTQAERTPPPPIVVYCKDGAFMC